MPPHKIYSIIQAFQHIVNPIPEIFFKIVIWNRPYWHKHSNKLSTRFQKFSSRLSFGTVPIGTASTYIELEVSNSTLLDTEAKGQPIEVVRIAVADVPAESHRARTARIAQVRGAKPPEVG